MKYRIVKQNNLYYPQFKYKFWIWCFFRKPVTGGGLYGPRVILVFFKNIEAAHKYIQNELEIDRESKMGSGKQFIVKTYDQNN